jgi:cysteine-rich repeat protein
MRCLPRALLVGPAVLFSCYSPNEEVTTGGGDGDSTEGSGSGTATSAITASSTVSATEPTTTNEPDSSDSTADTAPSGSTETTVGDTTTTASVCGDGSVDGDEVCDDGVNDGSYGSCVGDCSAFAAFCGDGIDNGSEACDDGDEINGNGCNIDCGVSGQELWTDEYDSGLAVVDDTSRGITADADDNVLVVGRRGSSPTEGRAWLRKYDPDGNIDWTVTDNATAGSGTSWLWGVAVDSDNELAAVGYYPSPNDSSSDGYVAKYSDVGDLLWSDSFTSPGSSNDFAYDVTIDMTDRITLTGRSQDDITVRRYTADGGNGWTDSVDGTAVDIGEDIVANSAGDIIVVGRISQAAGNRAWVRKYSSNGTEEWTTVLTTDEDAGSGYGVAVTSDDSIILVGSDANDLGSVVIPWVKRVTDAGDEDWTLQPSAGDVALDRAYAVGVDSQDAIVVGGSSDTRLLAFVKLDAAGDPLWGREYNLEPEGQVQGIAFDSADNVLVCGNLFDDDLWNRMWFGKFSP